MSTSYDRNIEKLVFESQDRIKTCGVLTLPSLCFDFTTARDLLARDVRSGGTYSNSVLGLASTLYKIGVFMGDIDQLDSQRLLVACQKIVANRRKAYGDSILESFRAQADRVCIIPEQVIFIHLDKQLSGVQSWLEGKSDVTCDSLFSRLVDAFNYLAFLLMLGQESEGGTKCLSGQ